MNRIRNQFERLKKENKKGLVTFITAGDPDENTSQTILNSLPKSGANFIEIGMPFSDPMADGPVIEMASHRALNNGITMSKTLSMVASFRSIDQDTPIILMGYYNPIYKYGPDRFCLEARKYGADGLIIVDLPPEEDKALSAAARENSIDIIRLVTPTTTQDRLDTILDNASGFLYYVSVTGVTGKNKAHAENLVPHLEQIRSKTDLPIAIGFGIKNKTDVEEMSRICDAVVVGSAIVNTIAQIGKKEKTVEDVQQQVTDLSSGLISA